MAIMNPEYYSINGQKMAIIRAGSDNADSLLMLHGGPGYYWHHKEIEDLSARLSFYGTHLNIIALQGRGCGTGVNISPYDDLTDDSLYKRAEDLKAFASPDILLGHSTGAMIGLTAVMEGFIKPKILLLLSPYSASLGEHVYWITEKAPKYPAAFARFSSFVKTHWQKYKGQIPQDLIEKFYIYWGELFFSLGEKEKILANLHYLDFHMIDTMPSVGHEKDEPFSIYKNMLSDVDSLSEKNKEALLRIGTINAHWWRTNFLNDYPFLEKLKQTRFDCPIYILSGEDDEITPPQTVKKLASILGVEPRIVKNSGHLPEKIAPGDLKENLVDFLCQIAETT